MRRTDSNIATVTKFNNIGDSTESDLVSARDPSAAST